MSASARPLQPVDEAAPARLLADHARRVLSVDGAVVTAFGEAPVSRRVVASTDARDLDRQTLRVLERQEQALAATDKPRNASSSSLPRGATARGGRSWHSAPIFVDGGLAGALHVVAPTSWTLAPTTRRMLRVFADGFGDLLGTRAHTEKGGLSDTEIVRVARAMADLGLTADTYEELVAGVTAAVAPLLDATKAGIGLWHGDSHYLQLLPGSFGSDAAMAASSQIRGSDPRSGAARVRASGKPYYTNNLAQRMPRYAAWLQAMEVTRLMTLPIPVSGRIDGVLHIANKRTDFVDADIPRAEAVVPFVAHAMEQVRQRIEAQRAEALATVVHRAATAVAQGESLHPFPASVLDEFCATIGARVLAISFSDGASPIVLEHVAGTDDATEEAFLRANAEGGSALRTATRRPRAARDTGWTALHAPVVIGGRVEATLSLLRIPCEAFSRDELAAVRRMTSVTALAWATDRVEHERLESARIRERQRIADDLHDHVAQILFSGQLTVQSILEQLDDNAPLLPAVARARDLLIRSQTSIREVIHHLSTPAPDGLVVGFSSIAESIDEEFGVQVDVQIAAPIAEAAERISDEISELAVKSAREAVVNAAKHAPGCGVWVEVRRRGQRLLVSVDDDGPGLPEKRKTGGYGVRAMRRNLGERGGSLRLGRSRRGGTRTMISLPLEPPSATVRGSKLTIL